LGRSPMASSSMLDRADRSGQAPPSPGWGAVAGAWAEHADYVDARATGITRTLLDRAAPAPGERVLDLACGPGGIGLEAAPLVGPAGEVVLSDASVEMTEVAAARARARGLDNVRTLVLDLARIDEPDASYDVVLCREGFMFAPDYARAAAQVRRILRPGGRFALSVWGPRERNPWLAIVLDAVSAEIGAPVPPPNACGPFSLADADGLSRILTAAGLADVRVTELAVPARAASFDEWWQRTAALTGPLSNLFATLPATSLTSIRSRAQAATTAYDTPNGLTLPGLTLLATAHNP
ncbi:MAG TPA: class I SAM-dependent methyltransferase, partial [Kofleriaceae bacterium]|nr:class I SAM-dependent methyltransferase [Kofleriaceae bacterium]